MTTFFSEEVFLFAAGLGRPLLRFVCMMSFGLFMATLIETLRWTRHLARLAAPLARAANLHPVSAASFAVAFFSAMTANSLLADSFHKGELTRKELIFANLFNSFPAYFLHLPTIFFMTVSVLGTPAVVYVGLVSGAALLRTGLTALAGHVFLEPPVEETHAEPARPCSVQAFWHEALQKGGARFLRRLPRFLFYTIPVYIFMAWAVRSGWFDALEMWLAAHATWLPFLRPEAVSIVVLHMAAEFGAALSAAGAIMDGGGLSARDVVIALLVGNVLSSPIRAFRHQFPSYVGYYKPGTALYLICINQCTRAFSIIFVGMIFYFVTL